jgi:hypothetical protein
VCGRNLKRAPNTKSTFLPAANAYLDKPRSPDRYGQSLMVSGLVYPKVPPLRTPTKPCATNNLTLLLVAQSKTALVSTETIVIYLVVGTSPEQQACEWS